jgi:hypothetical protein
MGKRASSGSADSTALSAAALSAAQVNADELQALVGDLVEVTIGASGDVSLGVGDAEGEEEEEEEIEEETGESDEEEEDLAAVEETEEEAEDIEAVEPAEETPTTVKTGPLMKRPAAKARLRKKPSAAAAEAAAADQAEADGFLMAIADAAIRVESGDLAGLDAPDTGIDAEDAKAVLDIVAGSQDDPLVQASFLSLHPNDVSNTERCYHVLSLGPHK